MEPLKDKKAYSVWYRDVFDRSTIKNFTPQEKSDFDSKTVDIWNVMSDREIYKWKMLEQIEQRKIMEKMSVIADKHDTFVKTLFERLEAVFNKDALELWKKYAQPITFPLDTLSKFEIDLLESSKKRHPEEDKFLNPFTNEMIDRNSTEALKLEDRKSTREPLGAYVFWKKNFENNSVTTDSIKRARELNIIWNNMDRDEKDKWYKIAEIDILRFQEQQTLQ